MVHGFLNIAKPAGVTSHDVVARLRHVTGQRRVGHAGTLDPLAEGVLPIALGRATRLTDRIGAHDKTYYARLRLGTVTETGDAEGRILRQVPLPPLQAADLEAALARFRGTISQVPPAFSAIKIDGEPAYRAARRGKPVTLTARTVVIYELSLLSWDPPEATLLVRCSRGTYIRALARDIGEALGVGGYLTRLVRLVVGPFDLRSAVSVEEVADQVAAGALGAVLIPADVVLLELPCLVVAPRRAVDIRAGRPWPGQTPRLAAGTLVRAYESGGQLLGLIDYDSTIGKWRPRLALVD